MNTIAAFQPPATTEIEGQLFDRLSKKLENARDFVRTSDVLRKKDDV
jgi:hypothetical protein